MCKCANCILFFQIKYTKGTVPFVYFSLKKVAEIFAGFEIFLYICSIIQRNGKAGRRPPGVAGRNVSNAMKNTYNNGKK